ncbi:MAG: tetratricopeptide repeat protein [Bacteroidota bacterium]
MFSIRKIIFLSLLFFCNTKVYCISKDAYADSLKNDLEHSRHDTLSFNRLLSLAFHYKNLGNYSIAHDYCQRAIAISNRLDDTHRLEVLRAEGDIYLQQGEYAKSQKSFLDALSLAKKGEDRLKEADILDQLGIIYWYEGDMDKALQYYEEAYAISETEGDFEAMSGHLNNIGLVHRKKGDYDKALECYNESADLCRKFGKKDGLANVLNNIGIVYHYESDFEKALDFYKQSLALRQEINDKIGITTSLGNIGSLYLEMKNYAEAKSYLENALAISEEISDLEGIKEISSNLSDLYKLTGDGLMALEYYKKFVAAKETLENAEARKQIDQQEMAYKFEMEKLQIEKEQQKKDIEAEADRKKQDLILYATLFGLLLVLVFAFVLFTRFRITNRQKKIIEEKNKEITDSINYAKRIQSAILAREEDIKKYFPESFLLYLPKDIVAGDFYFFETTPTHVFYAAADCTGHGVPGALVSVVCSNALTRCVKEFGLTDPGEILTKTRELVIETFEKSGTEVKDGMDIALCVLKVESLILMLRSGQELMAGTEANNQHSDLNLQLSFSGAHNPLWYTENGIIREIAGDKQSIGRTENPKPFTTHHIEIKKGEYLFMFTDGFADQFGGEKLKKLKYSGVKKVIGDHTHQSPSALHQQLSSAFNNWKGNNEQTDDVCVIGIRF